MEVVCYMPSLLESLVQKKRVYYLFTSKLIIVSNCYSNILLLLEGRIPSAWVAKPYHSTTGQRMTDSKKGLLIHLMSSLVRWTMNKVMKAVKKMGQQRILCVCTGPWGTKGKVLHTLSLVEHSYQQGMIVQLGNSITALGRVFLPPLVFCSPSRRKTSEYNLQCICGDKANFCGQTSINLYTIEATH